MKRGLSKNVRDMLLSLGVVIGLIAIVYVFTYSVPDDPVRVVDYAPSVVAARSSGAFDVAVPVGLTGNWRATSVRYTPSADPAVATWHLGFLTPDNRYAAVEQTNGTDSEFLKEATTKGKPDGTQAIGGQTWSRFYADSTKYHSLMIKSDGVTTVVTGTLSYDQLADFAASLRSA